MAVALRGYTALFYNAQGARTVDLPTGSAVGDLAIIHAFDAGTWASFPGLGPVGGWAYLAGGIWYRTLTWADITDGTILVSGYGTSMAVYSGAGGTVRSSVSRTVTTPAGSAAFWATSLSPFVSGAPAGSTYRLGSVVTGFDGRKHSIHSRTVSAAGSYTLDSVNSSAYVVGVVIEPTSVPTAPTILAPRTGSQVARSLPVELKFAHNSASGLPQESVRIRIRPLLGTWVSVKADGTLHTDDSTVLTQESGTVTIAADELANNTTYEWHPITTDAGGTSPAPTSATLTARTAPTVAVTLTTAAGDLSPTVSWVTTPGSGSQTAWEARICPAADTSPDDPVVPGSTFMAGTETEWTPPASTAYENGGSYKAWVRVADAATTGVWTPSAAATVSWTAPDAPTSVTLTQGTPPQVTVAGIVAGADLVEVQWLAEPDTDGLGWQPVGSVVPTDTTASLPVPLAEYGIARWYAARVTADTEGVSLPSDWTRSAAAVASTDKGAYLVDADDQSDYLPVTVRTDGPRTPLEGVSSTLGLGADSARVDYTNSAGTAGETVLGITTLAERVALEEWLDTHKEAFWFRWNPEKDAGTHRDEPALLIARAAPVPEERLAQVDIAHRDLTLAWVTQTEGA
jgi:hypothetical protein